MNMKYDVVIVGAGPAGLFSAYELITKNKKLKIALLDKGSCVKNRVCPMNKLGVPCKNCKTSEVYDIYKDHYIFRENRGYLQKK